MSSSLLCPVVTWPLLVCLWMLESSPLGLFCPKCSGGDLLPPSGVSFPIGTLGVGRLLCGRTSLSPSRNQGTCYLVFVPLSSEESLLRALCCLSLAAVPLSTDNGGNKVALITDVQGSTLL
uniref:TETY1 n=1 Tax=Felis catus TaxID=9685 RepID=A0A3G7HPC6_FELCA|nr:TETY1 [Felis catus]AZD12949.1 TETY1 [Felis catus]